MYKKQNIYLIIKKILIQMIFQNKKYKYAKEYKEFKNHKNVKRKEEKHLY